MREIKEYPILFNTEMVRDILAGKKTQTRRVIKPQPESVSGDTLKILSKDGKTIQFVNKDSKCPYGKKGDRLWVRETWFQRELKDFTKGEIIYRADGWEAEKGYSPWKPSIHMPRKYSRINLEITDIRVERVQDITAVDASKEGVTPTANINGTYNRVDFINCFHSLWDSINEKRGFGWDRNPWVWVVEFKKI